MLNEEFPAGVVELDINQLDKHWLEQPKLTFKWGMKLAEAKDAASRAKANLEVTRAEVRAQIAANPEAFSIVGKATVDAINSALEIQEDVLAASERYQEANLQQNLCYAMMSALNDRKEALEGLVRLHGQQYFATPVASAEDQQAMADRIKYSTRRIKPRNTDE